MKNNPMLVAFVGIAVGAVIGGVIGVGLLAVLPSTTSWPFLLAALGSYIGMVVARQLVMWQAAKARDRKR